MKATTITVSAAVAAPSSKVWEYWTAPEHITKWNFASPDWHCPRADNNLVVGGRFMSRMEAKDGSFGFDFEGVYDEVLPQRRLSYSMPDGRQVTTTFDEVDGTTNIVTVFDTDGQNDISLQQAGWQAILNNFKAYTEGN